jgi:DNA helicase-2/ATP-dependent DNA helicase PcrA
MKPELLLSNLNKSQLAAVTSVANTLAILAGPGSGKTHTLTSRTAWLLAQGLQPWNIIVATFTVKAAREMKERIGKLIGNGLESKLILGTFHSIARRYLARYGHLIGIKKDFGIADSGDSAAIIKRIIKRHGYMIDPKVARSRVSSCKARGAGYKDETKPLAKKSVDAQEFEKIYKEYEEVLERSNLLDYDDLLLRCAELLRNHPSCVSNVEAVLIDEFQDTNIVQFDLMRLFAAERKRITIVGDPDQSIYGFRAAEIKNYKRLLHQYPSTVTIALEENYRSSGSILLSALNIIQQDTGRVNKSLLATHSVGTKPVLRKLANAHKEAEWIVTEVQRCMGMTGDLLDLNDFAILVRSASLSRLIESALGKSGIAYRMVGGLRFYDRLEVKLVLDYLRVINQPDGNDALARIINTPSRRIGDTTIKALLEEAETSHTTLWQLILDSVQGRRTIKTNLKKAQSTGLGDLVNIILSGQKKLSTPAITQKPSIKAMIDYLLDKLDFENYLKKQHNDEIGARWENIQELMTQANDFQDLLQSGYEDEALPAVEDMEQRVTDDYLSRFLANVALASEVKNEESNSKPQLTISTIHAAKGLEWPVVFIPAAYEGSIPHSRAEDTDEERRLLYVAMTRAKALLYLSCPLKNSQSDATALSQFLTQEATKLFAPTGPSMGSTMVDSTAHILRRGCPTAQSIAEHRR